MRVTGIDACRRGWVAVSLDVPGPDGDRPDRDRPDGDRAGRDRADRDRADRDRADRDRADRDRADRDRADRDRAAHAAVAAVRVHQSLAGLLEGDAAVVVGIDMPLGLLESGWREADRAARGLLGPRRSSVFAIPPRAVWARPSYQEANQHCRELTGQGLSIQAWGLRVRLLEADRYRGACGHPLYEVHPELAFGAMAGAPLPQGKHTAAGRELRRHLLRQAGITVPRVPPAPVTDAMDAAAVAWSAWRIATGRAVVVPERPQRDDQGREIAIRF